MLFAAAALLTWHLPAHAAKVTECAKIGICYCVNDELKPTIGTKVDRYRQLIAEQRKAGKVVGYLSVPLTSAGGGNFNVNMEVAENAKSAIEKRFGADFTYVLNPTTLDADLPKGTGAGLHADVGHADRRHRRPRRLRFRLLRRVAGLRPLLRLRRQQRHGQARRVLRQADQVQSRLRERQSRTV